MKIATVITVIAALSVGVLSLAADKHDDHRGLLARFSLDDGRRTFKVGEPIRMRLEVTSYLDRPFETEYEDMPQYDFSISEITGRHTAAEIWAWSSSNDYPVGSSRIWQPKEKVVFEETWLQDGFRGKVGPGDYVAEGRNVACLRGGIYFRQCNTRPLYIHFKIVP